MMSKIDKCLKCGNQDFVNIAGVKTCKKCGTQHITQKNEINDNSNNMIIRENLLLTFGILSNNKKILIVLIPLIALIFVAGSCEATKPTDLPNYGINITNIKLTIHDGHNYLSPVFSSGTLTFDVLTKGTIDDCSVKINLFDRDNIIQTTSINKSSWYSYDTEYCFNFNESNNMSFGVTNDLHASGCASDYYFSLPRDNVTLTDFSIILEKMDNGVKNKIFETPKINIGNIKVRYMFNT